MPENNSEFLPSESASLEIPAAARHWAEISRLLTLAYRRLSRLMSDLVPLTESELMVLWACLDAPPDGLAQVALSENLGMSPAQISQLVDRLGEVGLLDSTRSRKDRRRRLWKLTDTGRETLFEAGCKMAVRVVEFDDRLNSLELGTLKDFLERLSAEADGPNLLPEKKGRAA